MPPLRVGIRGELLSRNIRRAIELARQLGYSAVQLDAAGELAPDQLSQTGRHDLQRFVASLGLQLSAWVFPARLAPDVDPAIEKRLRDLAETLRLAYQTGARLVIVSIGRVPSDPEHPTRKVLIEFLTDVAQMADRLGATVAVETGNEPGEVLAELLRVVAAPTVRCNYDPANLFVKGYDPLRAFEALHEYVVHCHAWDARPDATGDGGTPVPLGRGDVPWPEILRYLREAAYTGCVVVEQLGQGVRPTEGAREALEYLGKIR